MFLMVFFGLFYILNRYIITYFEILYVQKKNFRHDWCASSMTCVMPIYTQVLWWPTKNHTINYNPPSTQITLNDFFGTVLFWATQGGPTHHCPTSIKFCKTYTYECNLNIYLGTTMNMNKFIWQMNCWILIKYEYECLCTLDYNLTLSLK